jgi:hypothetical protein
VLPGNTGDHSAFTAIVDVVRKKFGLEQMVLVGDRRMITSARIRALNQRDDGTQRPDAYGWITALRAPPSNAHGRRRPAPAQPLRSVRSRRLIACRNPVPVSHCSAVILHPA